MSIIIGIFEQGLIYAIMAMGVYITYKILDFPDLSVDGTFPLGAAVTAILITSGVNPYIAMLLSFIAGAGAGVLTGLIHVKLKVRDLLSGIIVMTALYSINLRIAGKANVPIFSKETIFRNAFLTKITPEWLMPYTTLIIIIIITLIMKIVLDLYLKTRSGYLLRAVGDNEILVTSLAKDKGLVKIVGLAIANAFAALAGSVYCQSEKFFDVSIGIGTIVIGLASVIIGINVFRKVTFFKATTAVILGSIVYKACIALALKLGLEAQDLKMIIAVLFIVILVVTMERKRRVKKNA